MLLRARWRDGTLIPLDKFQPDCRRFFVHDGIYVVEADRPEHIAANKAYHAEIRTLWSNLPETLDVHYPKPEHLRKRALIKTGYYTANYVTLETEEEARVVQSIMKPLDEFSVVIRRNNVVRVYRPRSQRLRREEDDAVRMDADELKQSRKDVLDFCRALVSVSAADARKQLDFG